MSTTGGTGELDEVGAPDGIADSASFAAALTGLRVRAGMSIREVSRATGVPSATLGGWFSGRHQPPVAQKALLEAVLVTLGVPKGDVDDWWHALHRVRRVPAPRTARPVPYRGLEPYDVGDAEWFLGREELVATLDARVRDALAGSGPRFVAVVGASGTGKSSLLRAGLVSRLRREGFAASVLAPGGDPLGALAGALDGALAGALDGVGEARTAERARVVVVDQLEELFAERVTEVDRASFLTSLAALASEPVTVVVVALRADFYAAAMAEPVLLGLMGARQVLVGPLDTAALRRVIVEPATRAGGTVEPELVELLLRELAPRGGSPDASTLPLLSHALLVTWSRARGGRLAVADYVAAGGVAAAVQRSAEQVYAELDQPSRDTARRLFGQLVSVDDEGLVTRRRVHHADLAEADDGLVAVIDAFVAGRILTATDSTLEVSHEVLLTAWPRLAAWVDADREALRERRRVSQFAAEWDRGGRGSDALLRGAQLEHALAVFAGDDGLLTAVERDYLASSVVHTERKERAIRRRSRAMRTMLVAVTLLAVLTTLLSAYLLRSIGEADAHRATAERARELALSRQVAAEAARIRGNNAALAAQLAVAAYEIAPTVEARSQLLSATGAPAATRLAGPEGPMRAVATRDGRTIATATADGRVTLWARAEPATAPREVGSVPAEEGGELYAAAVSPDDATLVVGGAAAVLTVMDMRDPRRPVVRQRLEAGGAVQDVAFGRDGRTLVAAASQAGLRSWRLRAGRWEPGPTGAAPGEVRFDAVATGPAALVVTGGSDGRVRSWRLTARAATAAGSWSAGQETSVRSVAVSPDGRLLAAGTSDKEVHVREAATGRRVAAPLTGFTSWVNALAFEPDGSTLAAAASGGLVQVWGTDSWAVEASLPGAANLTSVAFLPGPGRHLLTGSIDGKARIVALEGPRLEPFGDNVWGLAAPASGPGAGRRIYVGVGSADPMVAAVDVTDPLHPRRLGVPLRGPATAATLDGVVGVAPDGSLLVAGTSAGEVVVWRLDGAGRPRLAGVVQAGAALVENIAFSADGRRFVASSDDGSATVFEVARSGLPRRVARFAIDGLALGVALDPDGSLVAVGGSDRRVHLFEVGGGTRPVAVLEGFEHYVYAAAFSADGAVLAAGSADDTVRLWDVGTPSRPRSLGEPLRGPADTVFSVAFGAGGETLLAASQDGSVWMWSLAGGAPSVLARLDNLEVPLFQVLVHPGGHAVTGAGAAGAVGTWLTEPEAATDLVCRTAGAPVSEAEWERHVPGAAYDPPC